LGWVLLVLGFWLRKRLDIGIVFGILDCSLATPGLGDKSNLRKTPQGWFYLDKSQLKTLKDSRKNF
jgi:hypothetical protein